MRQMTMRDGDIRLKVESLLCNSWIRPYLKLRLRCHRALVMLAASFPRFGMPGISQRRAFSQPLFRIITFETLSREPCGVCTTKSRHRRKASYFVSPGVPSLMSLSTFDKVPRHSEGTRTPC